jgi:hypothetical protein
MVKGGRMTKKDKVKVVNKGGPLGFVFFTAWIGALVYFAQNSVGFWGFVLAVLKSIVWPAFLIHQLFVLLNI